MAADMIEVAKATVTIIPNMQGAQQTISEQLSEISGAAGSEASDSAGGSFLSGFADKLSGLAGIMETILPAASVSAVGKALFDIGEQFDTMTDSIIVGTGATGEMMESLRQSAMDMATTVPMSFAEAGDVVQDLNTRLGLAGDILTDVGTQVARVSDMTGEAFSTEKFSGAMAAWGTAAEDMTGQLDALFAVSQGTGIGMNTLTGIMESAGPSMQALGYSFEETAAMAGLFDKAGLDASSMMSKMSKGLVTLAKDGEEPSEAFSRVTKEIQGYIESGDQASALDLASDIFGTKGAAQFVAAVKSGSMEIEDFAAQISNSSGIIEETQERTMSFGEQVTLLKNKFLELIEPMGSAVFQTLSEAMGVISEKFTEFVDGPGQVIAGIFSQIVDFGSQLGGIFMEAFGDTANTEAFARSVNNIGNVINKVGAFLKPLVSAFTQLLKTVLPPLARLLGTTLGNAFNKVGDIVNSVKGKIDSFKSMINSARDAFNTFKDKVTAPFNFLSGLRIPHISIYGGEIPYGIGGLGSKPSISVEWGARGGILDGATLIGAGEAGKEALLPLERNTEWMDTLADKVNGGNTFYINVNGAENPEQWAMRFAKEMKLIARTT